MRNSTFFKSNKIGPLSDGELEAFAHYNRGNLFIIDIRESDEYQEGHIVGARNIPLSQLSRYQFSKAEKEMNVMYYCARGRREQIESVKKDLLDVGFEKSVYCMGGIERGKQCGFPVKTSAEAVVIPVLPK